MDRHGNLSELIGGQRASDRRARSATPRKGRAAKAETKATDAHHLSLVSLRRSDNRAIRRTKWPQIAAPDQLISFSALLAGR